MSSKTPKQARFMAAIAHDPGFAKKVGVPQSVGKDFNQADAGTGILSKKRTYQGPGRQTSNAKGRTGKTRSWQGK